MNNIAASLVKAQKEFGPALKTSTNPHFRSRYADLSACIEAVIDALNNNGIYLMQLTEEHPTGVKVSTTFIHESGEQISGGSLYVPAAKNDPQGFGSALSYARRYSLMAACGIAPEDDDGNAAKTSVDRHQVASAPQTAPVAKPKASLVAPPKMAGKDSPWQLKISAEPETTWEDWLTTVAELTAFALESAQSKEDVMDIFRTNRVIYDRIQAQDADAYNELTAAFKRFKEKFNEQ